MGSDGYSYPSLNNAHQGTGISSGVRVNYSRTVGGLCVVTMVKKHSFLQVGKGEVAAHTAMFMYDVN